MLELYNPKHNVLLDKAKSVHQSNMKQSPRERLLGSICSARYRTELKRTVAENIYVAKHTTIGWCCSADAADAASSSLFMLLCSLLVMLL